jgi:hypothetical protein
MLTVGEASFSANRAASRDCLVALTQPREQGGHDRDMQLEYKGP